MRVFTRTCARRHAAWVSLFWLAGCAGGLDARNALAAEDIRCPSALQTRQSPAQAVTPWSASQQGDTSRLLYVEVYAGPWRQEQSLQPDETQDSGGRQTLWWRFKGQPSKEGTWLVCTYQNTQVKLEQRLPDSVTECRQVSSTDPKRVVKLLDHACH